MPTSKSRNYHKCKRYSTRSNKAEKLSGLSELYLPAMPNEMYERRPATVALGRSILDTFSTETDPLTLENMRNRENRGLKINDRFNE
jgi:hypothetical protein